MTDTPSGGAGANDHTHYNEEENMDRAAQAGVEGAFDADPDVNPIREQLQQDAKDAFGGDDTSNSSVDNQSPS